MRYGISIPNLAEPGPLVEVAAAAEHAGWDGFFLWDRRRRAADAMSSSLVNVAGPSIFEDNRAAITQRDRSFPG